MAQSNFSVLYAEDDILIRDKYAKFLDLYFKNIYIASDGEETLKLFERYNPNIIILDINMPIIDGLSVAKKIREKNHEVILIMLTAYSDREKLLIASDLFLTKYLIKPIETLELEEILLNAIDTLNKNSGNDNFIFLDNEFKWNIEEKSLYKNDKMIKLTQKELLLLDLFCSNLNITFSSIDIMNHIWEDDMLRDFNTNKLRVIFSKLKTKLAFNLFISIYNVGYKIKKQNS